jgi:hypothetical protein
LSLDRAIGAGRPGLAPHRPPGVKTARPGPGKHGPMSKESTTKRAATARPAWWGIAVLLLAGALLTAGCGSAGSPAASTSGARPGSPAAGGSPAAQKVDCKTVDSLRRSLESLSRTNVSPSSAGTLTADLKNIQTQAAALKSQSGGEFSGTTSELTAAVNQIQKAAAELTTNPASALQKLTAALAGLKGKIQPIIKQLNAACPKSAA